MFEASVIFREGRMRYIPQPNVNDDTILTALSANSALASHPQLGMHIALIRESYATYIHANSNPLSISAPQPLQLLDALADAMRWHYLRPPRELDYLADIRMKGSPDVCPMCGSLKTGTLDHVYEKSRFPEFSFFSKNIVPACDCNNRRQQSHQGIQHGERVLHPYFDPQMNQRLVRAKITSVSGSYLKPLIELEVCIPDTDPLFPAVKYHLQSVIMRTQVIQYLEHFWPKILRFYNDYFKLPTDNFTITELDHAVNEALSVCDRRRSTPNNWDSMLIAGLAINPVAMAFLGQHIRDMRSGKINPEDI